MFQQQRNRASQTARPVQVPRKLHSIHALLRGRIFDGQFEAQGATYRFSFVPAEASIADGKFLLTGRFSTSGPAGASRFIDNVQAQLLATQGGVGTSPVRRQLLTGTVQTSQVSTPEQKMEQEKGPETEIQPGLHAFENPKNDEQGRPIVESTGPLAFVGVLYFQLVPLDAQALGVPLDMSRVQLNARLAPTDDLGRDLQLLFSDLVASLYGEKPDERAASEQLQALNHLLKA